MTYWILIHARGRQASDGKGDFATHGGVVAFKERKKQTEIIEENELECKRQCIREAAEEAGIYLTEQGIDALTLIKDVPANHEGWYGAFSHFNYW